MTDLITTISGHFGKSLILGAMLPAVLFVVLWVVFVAPLVPPGWSIPALFPIFESQWPVITASFAAIVLTGLLYSFNVPIIRLFEGYPWKNSLVGGWGVRRYVAALANEQARLKGMRTLLVAIKDRQKGKTYQDIHEEFSRIGRRLTHEFPGHSSRVLPTHLGNVIRSYEDYPLLQYDMATITLWPRLIALIDNDYRAAIDDAKSTFDFMIHGSLLSLVLALAELFLGLFNSLGRFTSPGQTLAWIGTIAAFSFLSYLFYRLSISRAIAWGNLFRGAFDLYRWDLLQKMGYGPAPKVRAAERALWDKISTQVIYGDRPVSGPWVDYEEPATHARGAPENAPLEVTRGVLPTKKDGSITILLEVSNPNGKTVKQVVLSDRLPDGFDYEWDSAQLDGTSTRLTGTNPYRFIVGDLAPGEKTQLCYRAVRMVENK